MILAKLAEPLIIAAKDDEVLTIDKLRTGEFIIRAAWCGEDEHFKDSIIVEPGINIIQRKPKEAGL
ncbi:hypothetical protein FACS1894110_10180 [Spirochaetia bacterium]|nr:hypothetical protein FACS1894110_10180 [Spirochaetia bacterium]